MFRYFLKTTFKIKYKVFNLKCVNYCSQYAKHQFKNEENLMLSVYPKFKQTVLEQQLCVYYKEKSEVLERCSQLLDYTLLIPPVHYAAGIMLLKAYKYFEKSDFITEEALEKVALLSWCMRVFESGIIVLDDVFDKSKFRYNKPTRFVLVGANEAAAESLFLIASGYNILQKYFSTHPHYNKIMEETNLSFSSYYVSTMMEFKRFPVEMMEQNENLVKCYGFIVLPILYAMFLANIVDPLLVSITRELCVDIGKLVKWQDDIDDIYRPINDTMKDPTDISEGKTTWLAIYFNKNATERQRKTFEENYGKEDVEAVETVKRLYDEVNIQEAFKSFSSGYYKKIHHKITKLPEQLPKQLFFNLLDYTVNSKYIS